MLRSPQKSGSLPDMKILDDSVPPGGVAMRVNKRRRLQKAHGHDQDGDSPTEDSQDQEFTMTLVQSMMKEIKDDMRELNERQNAQNNSVLAVLKDIQQTNSMVQATITHLSEENAQLKIKLEKMEIQAKKDSERIQLLEHRFEDSQRSERKANIEIRNVPLKGDETKKDLQQMVFKLYKNLNIEITKSDIKDIIKTKKPKTERSTLIVEMSSTFIKTDLLKSAKAYNIKNKASKLSAKLMGLNAHPDTPIFISENLTPIASRLYFLARDFKMAHNYKYCWTSYGKVYLRSDDNSPIITVSSEDQLQRLSDK